MKNLDKTSIFNSNSDFDIYIFSLKILRHLHIIIIPGILSIICCLLYFYMDDVVTNYEIDIAKSEKLNLELDGDSLQLLESNDISNDDLFYMFKSTYLSEDTLIYAKEKFINENKKVDSEFKKKLENFEVSNFEVSNFEVSIIDSPFKYIMSTPDNYQQLLLKDFFKNYLKLTELYTYDKLQIVLDNKIEGKKRRIKKLKFDKEIFKENEIIKNESIIRTEIDLFNIEKKTMLSELKLNLVIAEKLGIEGPQASPIKAEILLNTDKIYTSKKLQRDMYNLGFQIGSLTLKALINDLEITNEPITTAYHKAKVNLLRLARNDFIIEGLVVAQSELNKMIFLKSKFKELYSRNNSFMVEYNINKLDVIEIRTTKAKALLISSIVGLLIGFILALFFIEYKYRIPNKEHI